jgi:hypothetical protein
MVANMGSSAVRLRVECGSLGGSVRVKRMDLSNAENAMVNPEAYREERGDLHEVADGGIDIDLPSYGVARIDREGGSDG